MRRGNLLGLAGIIASIILAALILFTTPIRFGLDLQGGVHVVMEVQETEDVRITRDIVHSTIAVIERRINALGVAEPVVQRQGDRWIIVELPGVHDQQQAIETIGRTALLEFQDPNGNTVFTGSLLQSATLSLDEFGRPAVSIVLNREGARRFAELTGRYSLTQQPLPIVLDGEVLVAPVPREAIMNGEAIITGNFTQDEARQLAILLQSGSLPAPLEVLEIRNVGPVLGQESVRSSLNAGIVGVILIIVFMYAYYRLPGFVASIALTLYIGFLMAVLVGLQATLTLPGIAGVILSISMAVDANVIIFERVKEELRSGKRLRPSIDAGWKRAFTTILDANLTTLIVTLVLFYFGTGPIKGFAVTLSVGIIVSMFTAIVVTRTILKLMVDRNPDKYVRYFGVREAVQ